MSQLNCKWNLSFQPSFHLVAENVRYKLPITLLLSPKPLWSVLPKDVGLLPDANGLLPDAFWSMLPDAFNMLPHANAMLPIALWSILPIALPTKGNLTRKFVQILLNFQFPINVNLITQFINFQRCKSRELRGGVLLSKCDCVKRNGLQLDCPRSECRGRPLCAIKPIPNCCPSKYTWRYANVTMGKPSYAMPKRTCCPKSGDCNPSVVECCYECQLLSPKWAHGIHHFNLLTIFPSSIAQSQDKQPKRQATRRTLKQAESSSIPTKLKCK